MTTQKNAKKGKTKKAKTAQDFYVVRSLKEAKENFDIKESLDEIGTAYKKSIETGKELLDAIETDARRILKMGDQAETAADSEYETVKMIKKTRETVSDRVKERIDTGREILGGVEDDARRIVDEIAGSGKKAMEKMPGLDWIEEKISSGLESIANQMNLPSKKDFDKLSKDMDALSARVEKLLKKCSVA